MIWSNDVLRASKTWASEILVQETKLPATVHNELLVFDISEDATSIRYALNALNSCNLGTK